ncbi:Uncharacterized protein BP5553_08863 [Venustampulla echinocandica]|uniref:DUF1753-domain-containing protein n=1 Tax=Venustampulla echinocandica TaxID=2656787 RepID=A0A370TD73_9HELO|nr:Uncharacterized protein BP5553_08863 [Venustampulla echinocandica]RDL32407.1 Uncharacterized protein BP5553_08863 [Venustampulla echinocandica]
MALLPRWLRLRVPRPRTFLYFFSLRTGVEMISLSMIFNKVTGFFGLLAILAGLRLSPLQLSMYLYSVAAVIVLAMLAPHIRKQDPFQCLALAWLYIFDTIINTAFTAAFAFTWFLAVSANNSNSNIPGSAPGSGTIDDTAGFTSPKYNASEAEEGQEAAAMGARAAAATAAGPSLAHGIVIEEGITSVMFVVVFTLIRVYFILIVMAFARQVIRQRMYSSSASKIHLHNDNDGDADALADNPFAVGRSEGQGWRGKLGRIMVKVGESYWLGGQPDDSWVKGVDGRFKSARIASGPPGTFERERRARSGTGPPAPQRPGK